MKFIDRTLLRMTDAAERAAVLSPTVGNRLMTAAFVLDSAEVGEVTGVSVRDIELMSPVAERQVLEGALFDPSRSTRWEASAALQVAAPHATADARVELFLTVETRVADTSIERVETESLRDLADLALVDARVVAADGGLPADPAALATRRFAMLKTMLRERFRRPEDFAVDGFFTSKGIDTVEDLLAYLSPLSNPQRVEVGLVIDGSRPARIANHRIIAGLRIEEDPVARLHAVIDEIQVARSLMTATCESARPPSGMTSRTDMPFILVFALNALDDADLPLPAGQAVPADPVALRIARLAELQRRLTPLGIALASIPT